jgi:hypothetical protein
LALLALQHHDVERLGHADAARGERQAAGDRVRAGDRVTVWNVTGIENAARNTATIPSRAVKLDQRANAYGPSEMFANCRNSRRPGLGFSTDALDDPACAPSSAPSEVSLAATYTGVSPGSGDATPGPRRNG